MKRLWIRLGVSAVVAAAWSLALPAQGAAKPEQKNRAAAKIVEEVLEQEAREGLPDRVEPLARALEQSPDYGPARWPSGFVYDAKHKQWLQPRRVGEAAKKDRMLAAYQRTREKSGETLEAQVELAQWCADKNLVDQARATGAGSCK